MSDWKVYYRDQLDQDRTTGGIPSMEAALRRAKDLHQQRRAQLYRIEGPGGQALSRKDIMDWVRENRY